MSDQLIGTVVEVQELWRTVVAALAAGVGVTVIFSLAIFGATHFADARRDRHPLASSAAAVLTVVCLAATVGSVVLGIFVMTSK
jgi:hypothetical protein